ncbi:MAG: aspartate carbamoyltransferase [Bacillota bacterium]|jgi:aspartate carbamoyltransferase catalytic subunit
MKNFCKPSEEMLNSFIGKDVLDITQYNKEELEAIINTAAYYEQRLADGAPINDMAGKIMASLFFEPSTRTRLSFEAAMLRLGGQVVTVSENGGPQISSIAKGESIYDSIKVIDSYCDIIVCRTAIKDSRYDLARVSRVPFINAGDGGGQHPTQALLDMFTIFKEKESPNGLTISLVGDLKYGRTVHSLADALAMYEVKMIFASPQELTMPQNIIDKLVEKGIQIEESLDLDYAVAHADIIYMTRVQKERFAYLSEYEKVKDKFLLTRDHLKIFKEGAIIMHPLPRVNEIDTELDKYKGAAYFRQSANGLTIRMALLALVTGSVK